MKKVKMAQGEFESAKREIIDAWEDYLKAIRGLSNYAKKIEYLARDLDEAVGIASEVIREVQRTDSWYDLYKATFSIASDWGPDFDPKKAVEALRKFVEESLAHERIMSSIYSKYRRLLESF